MYYIYKVTNTINNKNYIGQTHRTVKQRWSEHCCDARNNYDKTYFHKAIRKYGEDSFIVEIITKTNSQEECNYLEQLFINIFRTTNHNYGYNLARGGKSSALFDYNLMNQLWNDGKALYEIAGELNCTSTTVAYAVADNITYSANEAKRRGNQRKIAIKQYNENRELIKIYDSAISIAKELDCSEQTILKCIREKTYSALGYYWCPVDVELPNNIKIKNKRNKRGVYQYDLDNNYIQTFDTAANAARAVCSHPNINAAASSILQVCKGNRPTAYGYKWQYVEEDDKPARECTVDQVK